MSMNSTTVKPLLPNSAQIQKDAASSFLIGAALDFAFQGVVFCQVIHYLNHSAGDRLWQRLAVVGITLLTMVRSIQSFGLLWIQNVTFYNNVVALYVYEGQQFWTLSSQLLAGVTSYYVQNFFCYRLYILTKKLRVVIPIFIILSAAFVVCLLSAISLIAERNGGKAAHLYGIHCGLTCAGDILISSLLAASLKKARNKLTQSTAKVRRTTALISAVIKLSWLSMIPTTAVAIVNVIMSQQNAIILIETFIVNIILAKLYAMSMLYTLNWRVQEDKESVSDDNARGADKFDSTMVLTTVLEPEP